MQTEQITLSIVSALEEIKARDITVIDVRKLTSLFDTMVVATAESARQAKSLARNVQDRLLAAGVRTQGVEGEQSGDWVLVDLGHAVVHIMQPAVRSYYNIETLWGGRPPTPLPTAWRGAPGAEPLSPG